MPEINSLYWKAEMDASDKPFKEIWQENDEKYPIIARIVDSTVNSNRWALPENEMDSIVAQVTENQLRINHSKNEVMDIVGTFTAAERDGNSIIAKGFIVNEYVARLVHSKSVTDFSISAISDDVVCSDCSKSVKSTKLCAGAHHVLKGVQLKEISIVTEGAYANAKILPATFSASVDNFIDNYGQISTHEGELVAKCKSTNKVAKDMPDDKEDKKEDEAKAQDDDGMDKEVKSLKEEVKALKAQLSKAKKASDENKEKEKDAALETAAEAEKTALRKEISEIKEHLAAQTPKQGVSQAGKADGAPTGSLDACVAEIGTWLASTGHAWEGEE